MKLPYLMQTKTDCGPRTVYAVTGIDYDKLLKAWPGSWLSTDMGRFGAPNDTPWDHFVALETLDLPYKIIDKKEDLKADDIVLLHYADSFKPKWWPFRGMPYLLKYLLRFFWATTRQHWAVIDTIEPGVSVNIFMGGAAASTRFSWDEFNALYHLGWPNCAYRIGEGDHKVKWWHRAVAKVTGRII